MSPGIKLPQVTEFHFFHVCDENAAVAKVLMNQNSFVSGTTRPSISYYISPEGRGRGGFQGLGPRLSTKNLRNVFRHSHSCGTMFNCTRQQHNIVSASFELFHAGVCSICWILCQFMRALIDFPIALQWKRSHLLDTKQSKFTESSTLQCYLRN